MSKLNRAKMEQITDHLWVGSQAVIDTALLTSARNYKKQVASRYRLLNENDIQHIEGNDIHLTLKVDGQLHFLFKDANECFLFNCNGRAIAGLSCLDEANLQWKHCDQVLLAGELYYPVKDGRSRVYDVTCALSSQAKDDSKLAFAAFDILDYNHETLFASYDAKMKLLSDSLPISGSSHRLENHQVDKNGIAAFYNQWVIEQGQEGLVCVDSKSKSIYKIKPRHHLDAVILGFTESLDTPNSLRVLLMGLMRMDGSFQVLCKVGSGFDDQQRREMHALLKPMAVESSFNCIDRNHTLFTLVRPEVVIEMAFHDLSEENSRGKMEMKPVLHYDPKEGYVSLLSEAFVSVLGPVFKRLRDDKEVNPTDLRLTQLADYVDLDNLKRGARSLDLAKSQVLKRDVYCKTIKGFLSIRKFITWKTNKHELDNDYPAFVFCYVDYSAGRATPLKRAVRIASSEDAIDKIFDDFKSKEIKKGWIQPEITYGAYKNTA